MERSKSLEGEKSRWLGVVIIWWMWMDNALARAEILGRRWQEWIHQPSAEMEPLIEAQVSQSGHTRADIVFQLKHLAEAINVETLQAWVRQSWPQGVRTSSEMIEPEYFESGEYPSSLVCCVHAGNIPMVGLQDMLAICLAGGFYAGKLSRRDASLMQSWLDYLRHTEPDLGQQLAWSTDAAALVQSLDRPIEAWIFTGNESTWETIQGQFGVNTGQGESQTTTLVRRAEASVAMLEDQQAALQSSELKALAESMLLYQGKGCRSVGIIVSAQPLSFYQHSCAMVDSMEAVIIESRQDKSPVSEERVMERGWCAAHQIPHIWVDHLLIREAPHYLNEPNESLFSTIPGVIYWVQGDASMVEQWLDDPRKAAQIQSIYAVNPRDYASGGSEKSVKSLPNLGIEAEIEALEHAQRPPIDWTPDGQNPLAWVLNLSIESRES
ncbi:MAG: hypothetical protein RI513_03055 [Balneolaceae bacterium]|nr:hypothetical protein [Balneolaceae bacterium]